MFSVTKGSEWDERPQSILCNVIFCNANAKPSTLKEHFDHKHGGGKAGQDSQSLKIIRARFDSMKLLKSGDLYLQKSRFYLPRKSSVRNCKSKKLYTIVESLTKACALEIASIVSGKDVKQKLKAVSFSENNNVK